MTITEVARMPQPVTSTGGQRFFADAIYMTGDEDAKVILRHPFFYRGTTQDRQSDPRTADELSGTEVAKIIPKNLTTAETLLELRRRSGLTWVMLSKLFGVSRRTVYNWVNGRAPSMQQERRIRITMDVIRHLDEGEQRATCDRLLSAVNGPSPFDLLAEHRYSEVLCLSAGTGQTDSGHHRTALSKEEWARRRPPSPALLLDAMQDRPERPLGKVRIAHPVRRKKKSAE